MVKNIIEEDIDKIVGYTQNLWFILWVFCLSNLLVLEPIFELRSSINEFDKVFNEFNEKLNKFNKRIQQYRDEYFP